VYAMIPLLLLAADPLNHPNADMMNDDGYY
jgi:hypothetical protein